MKIEFDCKKNGGICKCPYKDTKQKIYYSNKSKKYYKLCKEQLEKDYYYDFGNTIQKWSFFDLRLIAEDVEKVCKNK